MARPSALPNAPTLPLSYAYASNQANQRTRMGLADGSYWVYQYDRLGQVVSGRRFWSDGTPVAGQQFEYGFDDIGNRTSTGGRESADSTYTVNLLNQYSQRTVAGKVDVFGIANPTADVTVNSVDADQHGEFFHRAVPVTNTSAAQYSAITVVSDYSGTQTTTGAVFVAKSPEPYTHDTDGNLTQDGRWVYVWDGENRLAKMRSLSASPAPERRLEFEYDWQGRRIRKTVYDDRDDGQGDVVSDTVFLYDGWNLIAELSTDGESSPSFTKIRTYVWGNDLSGSMQGAGGVGGLVKVVNHGDSSQHFAAYDGNGNVMGLVQDSNGTISARYEYGPFAEPLRASGTQAANPFRFSTKYCDGESGLYYYGYRYYNPSTGRWLNRDPIAERGGLSLYAFLANCPLTRIDLLGHEDVILYHRIDCGLTLAFDFSPKSDYSFLKGPREWLASFGSLFVRDSSEMLDKANALLPVFDPSGDCCRGYCIRHLSLSHHGDGVGVILLSTDGTERFSLPYEDLINSALARGESLTPELLEAKAQNENALSVLGKLSSMLCDKATVSLVYCYSEYHGGTRSLRERMSSVFGPGVIVETFITECGLEFAQPREL